MFRLLIVVVFLFSFTFLVANATEFEREEIAQEPMETEPIIEPRLEIDPTPFMHISEGEEGGLTAGSPIRIQAEQSEIQTKRDAAAAASKAKSEMEKKTSQQLQSIGQ